MEEQRKIGLLICYFGEFPWYFEFFLHSCKHNPTIDFYIITDIKTLPKILPANVRFIFKTLDEINYLASIKLGFETNIEHPYKLCDFKPAYGFLFSEIIENYDFWGYGDIDVIFGNIRTFISDELLDNYDIISVRHDILTGYFQLLKNSEKMIRLFMKSKDYVEVLSSNIHYCFDETNFKHKEFTRGLNYKEINSEIESMMHVVKNKEDCEALLYHLIKFKEVYTPKVSIGRIPGKYYIDKSLIQFT